MGFPRPWGGCLWTQAFHILLGCPEAVTGSVGLLQPLCPICCGQRSRAGDAFFKQPLSHVVKGVAGAVLVCHTVCLQPGSHLLITTLPVVWFRDLPGWVCLPLVHPKQMPCPPHRPEEGSW